MTTLGAYFFASQSTMSVSSEVAIFWDYENCPVPSRGSPSAIANVLNTSAKSFGKIKLFRAYLEEKSLPSARSELQSSGILLIDCPHNGQKEVVDKMIIADMFDYALHDRRPCTMILVTGDRGFAYTLSKLRNRNYQIVLVAPRTAHECLKSQASTFIDWKERILEVAGSSHAHASGSKKMSMDAVLSGAASSSSQQQATVCAPKISVLMPVVETANSPSAKSHLKAKTTSESKSLQHPRVPPRFQILVQTLLSNGLKGQLKTLRNDLAPQIADKGATYQKAGVAKFSSYLRYAAIQGVVEVGGKGNDGWVRLREEWCGKSSKRNGKVKKTPKPKPKPTPSPAPTPVILAKQFAGLIRVLQGFGRGGKGAPFCNQVSSLLSKSIYTEAGVKKWGQYVRLANNKGIVTMQGAPDSGRVSLTPAWFGE